MTQHERSVVPVTSMALLTSTRIRVGELWNSQQEFQRKRQRLGHIRLRTRWFQAFWILCFMMRSVVFIYLAALSIGYWFMASPVLENTRNVYNLPSSSALLVISVLTAACALLYAINLVEMVRFSVRSRRLAFKPRLLQQPVINMSIVKPAMPFVRRASSQLHLTYTKLFSPKGLLGIEHPCFEQILLARELVEILSQGYQVYTSSTLVPRRWMNDLSAILLVINCWSTCLVQAVVPKPLTRQRAVCLAVDTLLDFTWTVIIPFCICLPYAMAYDPDIRAFPDELLGDNSWQLSWQMDIQQLCITSWMDFIAKMVPCVGILASTRSITGVVVEERSIVKPAHIPRRLVKQRRLSSNIGAHHELSSVVPFTQGLGEAAQLQITSSQRASSPWQFVPSRLPGRHRFSAQQLGSGCGFLFRRSRQIVARLDFQSHAVFLILGIAIIVVHAYATVVANRAHMAGCLVPMRPWFASSYTCAYANINCYTHRTMGAVDNRTEISTEGDAEILTALSAFDSGTLLYLVLSHCSPLRVPLILNKYRSLTMLEIYNSSIFEWPDSAAITIRTHPNLRRLNIVQTKLSSVPNALLHESPVVVVNLIATNLTTLPPEISSGWKRLKYFNMEHGVLREIPSAMASLTTLERLSVSNNLISTTPTVLQSAYSVLNFANNPLQALPTTIRDPSKLGVVVFDNTLVADVPSWIYDATTGGSTPPTVSGTGTPFCKLELSMQETNARSNVTPAAIECVKPSHRANGYYPLATTIKLMALA